MSLIYETNKALQGGAKYAHLLKCKSKFALCDVCDHEYQGHDPKMNRHYREPMGKLYAGILLELSCRKGCFQTDGQHHNIIWPMGVSKLNMKQGSWLYAGYRCGEVTNRSTYMQSRLFASLHGSLNKTCKFIRNLCTRWHRMNLKLYSASTFSRKNGFVWLFSHHDHHSLTVFYLKDKIYNANFNDYKNERVYFHWITGFQILVKKIRDFPKNIVLQAH